MKKNPVKSLSFLVVVLFVFGSCKTYNSAEPEFKIETNFGNIVVKLYEDTPLHRDNFVKLVEDGTYEGVLFHRVIKDFMIQAGDPESKNAAKDAQLGSGDVGYTIPAEFVYPKHFHKKGALAAARQGDQVNPEKASSGCQFYIVQGKALDIAELENVYKRKMKEQLFYQKVAEKIDEINALRVEGDPVKLQLLEKEILAEVEAEIANNKVLYSLTDEQKETYTTIGGTPHLDNAYTVFGEVIEGLEIVDKIAKVETNSMDRPTEDVKIIKIKRLK